MRSAWARGAAAAGALLGLLGLGSCALVFNYGDYKDAPGDETGSGTGTAGGATGQGGEAGCTPDEMVACYTGPPGTMDVGICSAGHRQCNALGTAFGPCEAEITPRTDECFNALDEDCSGTPCAALLWSKRYGDADEQSLGGLSLDAAGNVLLTGWYNGELNLDGPSIGSSGEPSFGAFVAELEPSGAPRSLKAVGASPRFGRGVAKDTQGRVVVVGYSGNTNAENGFITQLKLDGSEAWTQTFGTMATGSALGVALDASDNAYVIGRFQGTITVCDDPLVQHTSKGGYDVLLLKYDSAGTCLWSRSLGAGQDDTPWGIAVDPAGQVFVTGEYRGQPEGLPPPPANGPNDSVILVMKVSAGGVIGWKRGFPSKIQATVAENARGAAIAVDHDGNPWVTGTLLGFVKFDEYIGELVSQGGADVFLLKLNHENGDVLWGTRFGAEERQEGTSLAVAEDGSVFVAGTFSGAINFGGASDKALSSTGSQAMFLAKLAPTGKHLWSASFGSDDLAAPRNVRLAVGQNAVVIAGGWANTLDFGGGPLPGAGALDVFVAKLGQ